MLARNGRWSFLGLQVRVGRVRERGGASQGHNEGGVSTKAGLEEEGVVSTD